MAVWSVVLCSDVQYTESMCTWNMIQIGERRYSLDSGLTCSFVWVWNLVADIEGRTRLRVFENRVLRRMFGPKRDEVTGEWRKLHEEELNDLYCSPSIVRVIQSGRMWWAEHVARIGKGRCVYRVWWGKPDRNRRLGNSSVGGRILLRWIIRNWDVGVWTGSSWLRIGIGGGLLWMR